MLDVLSNTIIKMPQDRERQIYKRLTGHKEILRYCSTLESGIRLEYASNYHLRSFNKSSKLATNNDCIGLFN